MEFYSSEDNLSCGRKFPLVGDVASCTNSTTTVKHGALYIVIILELESNANRQHHHFLGRHHPQELYSFTVCISQPQPRHHPIPVTDHTITPNRIKGEWTKSSASGRHFRLDLWHRGYRPEVQERRGAERAAKPNRHPPAAMRTVCQSISIRPESLMVLFDGIMAVGCGRARAARSSACNFLRPGGYRSLSPPLRSIGLFCRYQRPAAEVRTAHG